MSKITVESIIYKHNLKPMLNYYVELLTYRAAAELKRESSRAYLGILWWILEPLLYMGVFYLVFGLGMRKGGSDYVAYLLSGLIVWKWLESSVRTSADIIPSSMGLINQIYIPKLILPLVVVIANTYKFILILCLYLIGLVISGVKITPEWSAVFVLVPIQLVLISGMAACSAALVPLIPDLKYLVSYGLTLLFFMSGVFFDISELSPEVRDILRWNPMTTLIDSYRKALLYSLWPDWIELCRILAASTFLLFFAAWLMKKMDRYYPRIVE